MLRKKKTHTGTGMKVTNKCDNNSKHASCLIKLILCFTDPAMSSFQISNKNVNHMIIVKWYGNIAEEAGILLHEWLNIYKNWGAAVKNRGITICG